MGYKASILAVALLLSSLAAQAYGEPAAQARPSWAQAVVEARTQAKAMGQGGAFDSGVVAAGQPARKVSVDVAGWDEMWLSARAEGEDRGRESAVWGEPVLVDKDGKRTPLAKMGPAVLKIGRGHLRTSGRDNKPIAAGGKEYASALWHRPGEMMYKLGGRFVRLEAEVGVEASAGKKVALRFRVQRSSVLSLWDRLAAEYPLECDWLIQDLRAIGAAVHAPGSDAEEYPVRFVSDRAEAELVAKLVQHVTSEISGEQARATANGEQARPLNESRPLNEARPQSANALEAYVEACRRRRVQRLRPLLDHCDKIVFTKHFNMGGSHYAYTEAVSDGVAERNFRAGTALCLLERSGDDYRVRTLLEDDKGVIRDPAVSYDARTLLFSWKKSDREDDYHLYDMDVASGSVRQITSGLGHADYEADYLPNGDIVFNSTRCVQFVDCWITEVSNLYTCDKDGKFLRRLSFDQVHTNFPAVTGDGIVLYTRWDYNDRGQIYPQGLFQMNADGTNQTEFYGNNSFFPTTILHARGIPGTQNVIAIATGHHSRQTGKLIVIDPSKGRQENEGVQLAAPLRETRADRIDAYGQDGELFQYPYPVTARTFLVAYHPWGWEDRDPKFGVYFMDIDGRRELLASDARISCNQAIPVAPRKAAAPRPSPVNYAKKEGTFYVQDVYVGPGLAGIERGTVKKLRVIGLDFRPVVAGGNGNGGPAGGAFVSTPVSTGNGCWDPKIVLGEAEVHADGSAFFTAPAHTPLYFQCVDENGCVVQTMRSWATLQPGENAACVGCHESKNSAPIPYTGATQALKKGAQPLAAFHGPARGFSYAKEIQPILDKHCIRCHDDRTRKLAVKAPVEPGRRSAIDVSKACQIVPIHSTWRYTMVKPADGWHKEDFDDSKWQTGQAGFGHVGNTRWNTPDICIRQAVTLTADQVKQINCIAIWHDEDAEVYINGVLALKVASHRDDYTLMPIDAAGRKALRAGKNVIAVSCKQTAGGQYIDVGLADDMGLLFPRPVVASAGTKEPPATPGVKKAFSLLGNEVRDERAKRIWSDSYIALTNSSSNNGSEYRGHSNDLVNWISVQSVPSMLTPYSAGACRSRLITMLREGHNGVKLSRPELERIACWIDLLVPFCGDYFEANTWSPKETERYEYLMKKRKEQAELERRNVREMLQQAGR